MASELRRENDFQQEKETLSPKHDVLGDDLNRNLERNYTELDTPVSESTDTTGQSPTA